MDASVSLVGHRRGHSATNLLTTFDLLRQSSSSSVSPAHSPQLGSFQQRHRRTTSGTGNNATNATNHTSHGNSTTSSVPPSPSHSRVPAPKIRPVSHTKKLRSLQAQTQPNDPINLALSYAITLKPLDDDSNGAPLTASVSHSSTSPTRRAPSMVELLHGSSVDPPSAAHSHTATPNEQKETANDSPFDADQSHTAHDDQYTRAIPLRPHLDNSSFVTRSSSLNPNARLDARDMLARRRAQYLDQGMHVPLTGEDEEDLFWRDLFTAQTKPGTKTHTRQLHNAIQTQATLLDRGVPIVKHQQQKDEVDTRTSEERVLSLVEQLRSTPSKLKVGGVGGGRRRRKEPTPQEDDDDDDEIVFEYSLANRSPFSHIQSSSTGPRSLMDDRGFVRSTLPELRPPVEGAPNQLLPVPEEEQADQTPKPDTKKTPQKKRSSMRLAKSAAGARKGDPTLVASNPSVSVALAGSSADHALLSKLAHLDYEYEYLSDAPRFFRPKYVEHRIHPQWLRERDDFKMYFSAQNNNATTTNKKDRHTNNNRTGGEEMANASSTLVHGGVTSTMRHSSSAPALRLSPGKQPPLSPSPGSMTIPPSPSQPRPPSPSKSPSGQSTTRSSASTSSTTASFAMSELAASVTHPSPTNALDLMALHAAEKAPEERSAKDKANIVQLLTTIEYFARLPTLVREGLAELVVLQRANKDEVLFTRIHGTKFMYVFSGSVVSSSSISGEEFTGILKQTHEVRDRIFAERHAKAQHEERRIAQEKEDARRADRVRRGLDPNGYDPTAEELAADAARLKAAEAAKAAALEAKRENMRIMAMSRSALKEKQLENGGRVRPSGWSTVQKETDQTLPADNPTLTTAVDPSKSSSAAPAGTPMRNSVKFDLGADKSKSPPPSSATHARMAQQQSHASARGMMTKVDSVGGTSKEIRGFQIGQTQPAMWNPHATRTNASHLYPVATPTPTPLAPAYRSLRPINDPSVAGSTPSEHVSDLGMVFRRVLPESSLFGQNDMFEHSYAGLDRVLKLKAYQLRLTRILNQSATRKLSSGWVKLKTLFHVMITARDKAPMEAVVAHQPCILFTWSHKELEKLIVSTKERTLNNIISSLNSFRELLFTGWTYKMLLSLSSVIEWREFGPKTVLYRQGFIDKPVWDESTHLLRSAREVFEESTIMAKERTKEELRKQHVKHTRGGTKATTTPTPPNPTNLSSIINNFGFNPANHSLFLLTSGMLQLEKRCEIQRAQRWPSSINTWEVKSTLVPRNFFGGFIRGKEIIGGETFLGMTERDFTVSVPPGQTATCIVIKRGSFDAIMQKRIQHAVWTSVVRLRELASTTINSRIALRNHSLNYGMVQAVKYAKQPSSRKIGSQSVNEYLSHLLRSSAGLGEASSNKASAAAAITHMQSEYADADLLGPVSKVKLLSNSKAALDAPKQSAAFAPTIDIVSKGALHASTPPAKLLLNKIFSTPRAQETPTETKLEDLIAQAAMQVQAEKDEKKRIQQEKMKATSERILAEVAEATAAFDVKPESTESSDDSRYVFQLSIDTATPISVDDSTPVPVSVPSSDRLATPNDSFRTPHKRPSTTEGSNSQSNSPNMTPIARTPTVSIQEEPSVMPSPYRLPTPANRERGPTVTGSSLGRLNEHPRQISTYINNLPLRRSINSKATNTFASPTRATPASTASPYTPPPHTQPALSGSQSDSTLLGRSLVSSSTLSPLKSPSRSKSNLLPSVLSPLAASLPTLLHAATPTQTSASGAAAADVAANRAIKSFSRTDARDRHQSMQKEDASAARIQARIDREAQDRLQTANTKHAFQVDIQKKLHAYDQRIKAHQAHKEAAYAAKIVDINRKLQNTIQSSFYDNPFDRSSEAALEVFRNQAKLKQLLQVKAERAAKEKRSNSTGSHDRRTGATSNYLTAAELQSIGISLPPPPLPIEDLSLVAKNLWEKHIRYLTDLEAEQRLVYAEYMTQKRALEAAAAEHDSIRVELLNKRYLKGVWGDYRAVSEEVAARGSDSTAKRDKADEEWRAKREFEELHESMLAMGVAGDEEAEYALLTHVDEPTDPARLNQNLHENASFTIAQLTALKVAPKPLALDAISIRAAAIVANMRDEPILLNPAMQMELTQAEEPPITDVIHIKQSGIKTETHSDIVPHSSDVLLGSVVGLYFPPMPPPPDIRRAHLTPNPNEHKQATQQDTIQEEEEENTSNEDGINRDQEQLQEEDFPHIDNQHTQTQ